MEKKVITDVIKVSISNLLIVLSGIATGFALPKILGVTDYGLYKIFNLYASYTVFCDLGISNGIYLKYGGYERKSLPEQELRLYFKLYIIIQCLISFAILVSLSVFFRFQYFFLISTIMVYGIINNVATYFERVSVMIGEFRAPIQRNICKSILSIAIVILLFLLLKLNLNIAPYKVYILLFIGVYIFLAIQYSLYYKELIVGKKDRFSKHKKNFVYIIKSGAVLMFADTIANMVLNLDRQFVSIIFSIDTYAVYSFAYSMLKVIVLAITAIATVMYPMLKRMTADELNKNYIPSISIVSIISFGCLMAYYPLSLIVECVLSSYREALPIFRVLFPGISINSVISLVMINNYKALSQQNRYFKISLFILLFSFLSNCIAYILTRSPIGFSSASVLTIFVWYLISDFDLKRKYRIKSNLQYLYMAFNIFGFYFITERITNYCFAFLINFLYFLIISSCFYKGMINRFFYLFIRRSYDK